MRERVTVAFIDVEALQGSVVVALSGAVAVEVHAPAVAAVVEGFDQQAQEEQPSIRSAEEAQQQPVPVGVAYGVGVGARVAAAVGAADAAPQAAKKAAALQNDGVGVGVMVVEGLKPVEREAVGEQVGVVEALELMLGEMVGVGETVGVGDIVTEAFVHPAPVPARQKLVPQSALEAQVSPGELSTHVPVPKWHAPQPCRAAFWVQQKPPRHALEAQAELKVQGEPASRMGVEDPAGQNAFSGQGTKGGTEEDGQ